MARKIIQERKRIFIAGEGESEQSLMKWCQQILNQQNSHIHLDCQTLEGGGYKTMLQRTIRERKRKERYKAKFSVLLVDGDRDEYGDDGWSISRLRQEALKHKIVVCVLQPNLEGLLLRLMPGNENLQPIASTVQKQLRKLWPNYEKPVDARTLAAKFSLMDLLRVARADENLAGLLKMIELIRKK